MTMKLGIPRFGIYSNLMRSFLEGFGIEVIMPAKITRDMIKLGVANSADMVCYPFKTTLGQEIWALENGATDLLMFNSCGLCRLKHYYQIQEHTLRNLGYQFNMNVVTKKNLRKEIKRLLNISFLEALALFKKVYFNIQELEDNTYRFLPTRDLKIGIVGEVYCYSDDTEVLTENGWKLFSDLEQGERIVQVNPENLELTLTIPHKIYSLDYKGKIVQLKSKQLDLLVTPNHRMLYENAYKRKREIKRIDQMPVGSYILRSGHWKGMEIEAKRFKQINMKPEQFSKFMGIWLAEGSISSPSYIERDSCGRAKDGYRKRYYIFITQKDKIVRERIEKLYQEIGINIDYNNYSKKAGSGTYRFQNKELWLYLKQFGKSHNKFVPREILNAKGEYLECFLEWFGYGDGGIVLKKPKVGRYRQCGGNKSRIFYSSSKQMIDGIQEASFKINKTGCLTYNRTAKMYQLRLKESNYSRVKRRQISYLDYDGKVSSVSVDNGFIVVRRNGIACISGNTCWERDTNFDIVKKLQRRGVNVHMSITVTDYLRQNTHRDKEAEKEARKLLTQELGGHGFESICNTIWYGKNGYDGVIHLLPLSCMPESTVEPLVDHVAEKYGIPLYRFPIDENNFEAGFSTRLETFISMLRRGKSGH